MKLILRQLRNIGKKILLVFVIYLYSTMGLSKELVLGGPVELKPYIYQQNGRWTGVDFEISTEVYKRLGIKIKYNGYPWIRAVHQAQLGRIDGLITMYCSDIRSNLKIVTEQLYLARISAFSLRSSKIEITGIKDFYNRFVGYGRGDFYGPLFSEHKEINTVKTISKPQLIKLLASKRIDFVFDEDIIFRFYAKRLKLADQFKVVYTWREEGVCMALSIKALEGEVEHLSRRANNVIERFKQEGGVDRIINKYTSQ